MISKGKLVAIAMTSVVTITGLVGAGTYALFTSSATNTGNAFTAGTLKIDSARDDIPMTGPMFYTESPSDVTGIGGLATGVWAPGDTNTRGLFLHNSGSLDAKLTDLTATPVAYNGKDQNGKSIFAPVSSGAQYDTDMAFANNALVTIWEISKYDPTNDKIKGWDVDLSGSDIDVIMQTLNAAYQTYETLYPAADPYTLTQYAQILDGDYFSGYHVYYGNAQMLEKVNQLVAQNKGVNTEDFQVTKVIREPLKDFLKNGGITPGINVTIPGGGTELLGYSVNFNKKADNSLQGITPYFNFGSDWAQVRNNP